MKLIAILLLLALTACAANDTDDNNTDEVITPGDDVTVLCTEPRPDVCAQVYEPVCGSDGQTHSNPCVACSNADVDWYVEGEC